MKRKRNRKKHPAGRIMSLLLVLCMVLAIAPITAFAGVNYIDKISVTYNAPAYKAGDAPQAVATVTEGNCSVAYEYWREIYQPEEGGVWRGTGRYWYSDADKMASLASDKQITRFEAGHSYTYNIVLKTDSGYFISGDTTDISVGNYNWGTVDKNLNLEIKNLSTELHIYSPYAIDIPADDATIAITLVDVGNIWKELDSTKPVAFTTELNPNTDCPKQMEITEQKWMESESGAYISSNEYPQAGKEYVYEITLTAKEGYFFSTFNNTDCFDGGIIVDGINKYSNAHGDAVPKVYDNGKALKVLVFPAVTATDGVSQDDYVIDNVVINNAPTSCTVGEAPKAMATKGDDEAYTFYEYWEEWAETENGMEPVKFWYSDAEQMNRVPEDKRITAFEEGKTYSYSVITQANENYTFASKDDGLSVMLNGKDFIAKSEMIWDGKSLMIGPGAFMTPTTPVEQKEISVVEINNATLTFKDGDKPVFTGTTPDDAPYVLDYEGWFGEDDEFLSSSDYWNSAYVERDWCDGLISSFKANTEYTYQLYLKLTDEAAAQGYVFGPNTKLKVNGKNVEYPRLSEIGVALQIGTELTMKPTTPTTQKEIPVVEINNATLTFKDGDKPVFTGTTSDDAPYVLVFEEWRTDGEWTRSDEWFNDADHHGEDKDITAFDKEKTYNYNLYIKQNSKGWEEGWYFGPNTKLKINGKEVSFTNVDPNAIDIFMVTTGITMKPTAAGASDYKIIEGANGAWTENSDGTLVFRANGDFGKFTGVKVDGTLIDAKNYTAVSGSTVITLKADYLKTLSVGTHKLTVVYTDGECSTKFEIKAAPLEPANVGEDKTEPATPKDSGKKNPDTGTPSHAKSPQTGDNRYTTLWIALLAASALGFAETVIYRKRKRVR